ncbi:hypothetical protein KEM54_002574 [Ascosphaera aggregata]|nr:hypothetical protein KEM54_002574 [Ascosphaera aggregata]
MKDKFARIYPKTYQPGDENPVYIADMDEVYRHYDQWMNALSRVRPFQARLTLHCPPALIRLESSMLSPETIAFLRYAAERSITLLYFYNVDELYKVLDSIKDARRIFDEASAVAYQLKILDIEAGFSADTFDYFRATTSQALNTYFPPKVRIIAKPGRLSVALAFTLAATVIAGRETSLSSEDNRLDLLKTPVMIYLNDGVINIISDTFVLPARLSVGDWLVLTTWMLTPPAVVQLLNGFADEQQIMHICIESSALPGTEDGFCSSVQARVFQGCVKKEDHDMPVVA